MFASSVSVASLLLASVIGADAGLPLGMPPGKVDPVMARVAPEQCVFYFSWAASVAPDPQSKNETERLLAEPEVQQLIAAIQRLAGRAVKQLAEEEESGALVAELLGWGVKSLHRPAAFYLGEIGFIPGRPPQVSGGAVFHVGQDAAALGKTIQKLVETAPPDALEKVQLDEQTLYRVQVDREAPAIEIYLKDSYLYAGVGKGEVEAMLKRAAGDPPAWLTNLNEKLPIPRRSTTAYINAKSLIELSAALPGGRAKEMLAALGLGNITAIQRISGLDETASISRSLIALDGKANGLLSMLEAKPLTKDDLEAIPADATLAVAARLDLAKLIESILSSMDKIQPGMRELAERGFGRMEEEVGIPLREELINALGDSWRIYHSPREGGYLGGFAAVVKVRDRDRLLAAERKFVAMVEKMKGRARIMRGAGGVKRAIEFPDGPRFREPGRPTRPRPAPDRGGDEGAGDRGVDEGASDGAGEGDDEEVFDEEPRKTPAKDGGEDFPEEFEEGEFEEHHIEGGFHFPTPKIARQDFQDRQIYYFRSLGFPSPFAPAWCITDDELVIAVSPQMVRAFLSRGDDFKSLATRPEVASLFDDGKGPLALSYCDTPELFRLAYPWLQIGAQLLMGQLQEELDGEDLGIDISLLPSGQTIVRHLRPGLTTVTRTEAGLEVVSRRSVPGAGAAFLMAATLGVSYNSRHAPGDIGGGIASVLAPSAARLTQSMNNMKQIGLAMHNYHDAFRNLPPAYNADKEGKPLLSWRVHILPFIEQGPLYERFRLDEPWDSEHNKKLIPLMPPIYRAPGSKAGAGKTNYLTVRGMATAFPSDQKIGFQHILDGTSNTIMTVEAGDKAAVIWTKPDDFRFDPMNPIRGLVELRKGGFLAGMCDGSVFRIKDTIDKEQLLRLIIRNDGKVVGEIPR